MNNKKEINNKFLLICDKFDINKDLSNISLYDQTILLTYHVLGLILVNGLYNTLQDVLDYDPKYMQTLAAFERIGSIDASNTIKKCLKLISYEKKHKKLGKRRKKIIDDLEDVFLGLEDSIIINLYNFIKNENILI